MQKIGADIYTGACHKWMMTPKEVLFYTAKRITAFTRSIDHQLGVIMQCFRHIQIPGLSSAAGYQGFSAFLTIPDAIAFMKEHDWTSVAARCRQLVKNNAIAFCNLFQLSTTGSADR